MKTLITPFYHRQSATFSYVVADIHSKDCIVIDPCYDFELSSGVLSCVSAKEIVAFIQMKKFKLTFILETHAHADHISSAQWLKKKLGGQVAIGESIVNVQKEFKSRLDLDASFQTDGSQFDHLLKSGEKLNIGDNYMTVTSLPGHTEDGILLQIDDNHFVGDSIFHPSLGTARCDFPGGSAESLYESIQTIHSNPDSDKLYLCHDYPNNESPRSVVTVKESKTQNIMCSENVTMEEFVEKRKLRDAGLSVPKLLYPSIQININAGIIQNSISSERPYVKIPLSILE